jgi:hypothetical protein
MPPLSAWTIRIALLYLLGGFSTGSLILAQKGVSYYPAVWLLLPAHIEFLVIGWTVNLIFGVAYWILPRFPGGSRGSFLLPFASILLLNLGILLSSFALTWRGSEWILLAGRAFQALAVALFAVSAWKRVRPTVVS